ncbi:MAG: DMT family transporter [Coriobacteriaceae bacterium]|nr:DMT family transporter [Coriobacteriaceae bacterium]
MSAGRLRFVCYMVIATALFGACNVMLKYAYEGMGPYWCGVFRFAVAAAAIFLVFRGRIMESLRMVAPRVWLPPTVFMGGAFLAAGLTVNMTTATNAGFFFSLPMLFAPLLGLIAFRKRFGAGTVALQGAVLVGLYLLCCNTGSLGFGPGEAMGLACSAFYAAALVFGERAVDEMDPFALAFVQLACSCVLFLGCALAFEPFPAFAPEHAVPWIAVVLLAVSTALAFALQDLSLERISPTVVAVIVCSEPIFTALFAFGFLGETLSVIGLVGAAIVVACTVLASTVDVDAALQRG